MKKLFILILLLIFISGCHQEIDKIAKNIEKYEGDTVTITGRLFIDSTSLPVKDLIISEKNNRMAFKKPLGYSKILELNKIYEVKGKIKSQDYLYFNIKGERIEGIQYYIEAVRKEQ